MATDYWLQYWLPLSWKLLKSASVCCLSLVEKEETLHMRRDTGIFSIHISLDFWRQFTVFKSNHYLKKKSPKAWVLTNLWTSATKQCGVLRLGLFTALLYFSDIPKLVLHVDFSKVTNVEFCFLWQQSSGQWTRMAINAQQSKECTTRRIFAPLIAMTLAPRAVFSSISKHTSLGTHNISFSSLAACYRCRSCQLWTMVFSP